MKFNKKYTDYWQKTVLNSIDGTKIPGPNEAEIYLKQKRKFGRKTTKFKLYGNHRVYKKISP